MKKLLFIPIALVVAIPLVLLLLSTRTRVAVEPPPKAVGIATPVAVRLANPHGVRIVRAYVEQNGKRTLAQEQALQPSTRLFWKRNEPETTAQFTVGKQNVPTLAAGKAKLIVEAISNDFRSATDSASYDVAVVLEPPRVVADGAQHYINQGGSELVTFTVSGDWSEAGVRVGRYTFRSFPLPGKGDNERFSLFALPYDMPASTVPVVYARNAAGTEATAQFWYKVFPKQFRSRDLPLDDKFLQKVAGELDPSGSGDLLPRFLKVNREMRKDNNARLAALRDKSQQRFLWSGPFLQLANSQVEALFADYRSYFYNGKKVDEQVHLGFDLSKVKNADVVAANDGVVVYAAPLGIYGNCIVLDHGYGLQSIYAHQSEMLAKEGQAVKKSQTIGRSGVTGLAGGDHLHFSMQLDGVQINPVEWWDAHWIKDRVLSKLPASAFPAK